MAFSFLCSGSVVLLLMKMFMAVVNKQLALYNSVVLIKVGSDQITPLPIV